MALIRFVLILYNLIVAQSAVCHTLLNGLFEVNEDMIEVLLVLDVLITSKYYTVS